MRTLTNVLSHPRKGWKGFSASTSRLRFWQPWYWFMVGRGCDTEERTQIEYCTVSKLGVPLKLKHSYIRSLKLKIPWKSLTSSKIEIYFWRVVHRGGTTTWEGVGIQIPTSSKDEGRGWSLLSRSWRSMRNVTKLLKADDSGFTDRLVLCIIDNLQVQISDIHVRFGGLEGRLCLD